MYCEDELYGGFQLRDDVLIDLLQSKEVQRLKDIHMAGPAYLLNSAWNETRYEHSLGVMLLIRKMGGTLEEQIAGLLHDISHTAFSHLIDFVLDKKEEDFHEEIKMEMLEHSSLPKILRTYYGYEIHSLLGDDDQWEILEQKAPDLCADRVDYTLREVHRYYGTPIEEIHSFLAHLKLNDGHMVVDQVEWGEWFIRQYNKVVIDFFYEPLGIYSHVMMKQVIALALKQDIIKTEDFFESDSALLKKMSNANHAEINQLLNQLTAETSFQCVDSNEPFDIFHKTKTRFVDPLVLTGETVARTSTQSSIAKEEMNQALKRRSEGLYLKIIQGGAQ